MKHWVKGIILKLFPYSEQGKKDADAEVYKAWTLPDELYFYPYAEVSGGEIRTVGFPKDNLNATVALDDVNHPKQVIMYKKVRTFWVARQSEVTEVPAPENVVQEPVKLVRKVRK